MDSQPNNTSVTKGEIRFPNDNRAVLVKALSATPPGDLIKALEIPKPSTVLLLIGGAGALDPRLEDRIELLLDRGLVSAAAETNTIIVDGGTKAGVMEVMGRVIAARGRLTPLLGIAPEGKVTYPGGPPEGSITEGAALDPNHSHFVLAAGAKWSDGTELMFQLVSEFAKSAHVKAVLINGGEETKNEVSRCVERGWPIIVVKGSGRVADEVAEQVALCDRGAFQLIHLDSSPSEIEQALAAAKPDVLLDAWKRFAEYDMTAGSMQKRHRRLLTATFILGVLGTLLALNPRSYHI